MNVTVQHLETKLYLASNGSWVDLNSKPAAFRNPLEAISFCIQLGERKVRLVSDAGSAAERHLYPFGADPAIKAERKRLRRSLAENRRLKRQKRILLQRIDILSAESKERKKLIPFTRKPISND